MTQKILSFIHSPWLKDRRVLLGLYVIIGMISAITKMSATRHNNYDIFRYVFYNTIEGKSLYAPATDGGYWDINHYGPCFSLIIAPFAMMPTWLGLLLWCTALAIFLFWAIDKYSSIAPDRNGVENKGKQYVLPFIVWFCTHEMLTALFMQQFNVAIAAIILLSFYFVEKGKDQWATLFIVIGTLVKLYGIVGIAFFFFSRHKVRFAVTMLLWSVIVFLLPALISSVDYQVGQYQEWFECILGKNEENLMSPAQNISLLGIVRKIGYGITGNDWWITGYKDLWLILSGMIVMAAGYFRINQWTNASFRNSVLASVLMFVCLFSTGTESSGYIIALAGCAIWYCVSPWKRTKWDVALLVFAFILTSLSPSDLFPRTLRQEIIQPYALKALPVAIIWMKLCYELITKNYEPQTAK